jgi:hypothetical protein
MRVRPESVTHLVVKFFNVKEITIIFLFGNNFFGLSGFLKSRLVKGETNLILI